MTTRDLVALNIGFWIGLAVGIVLTGHEATGYWPWQEPPA